MVSCQILMFDIYFLQNVARPIGVSLKEIAERYDSRLGQPEADVPLSFLFLSLFFFQIILKRRRVIFVFIFRFVSSFNKNVQR